MPRPVDKTDTVDLHAPWWSEATEPSGRYRERWVVRKEMSERNQQQITGQLRPILRMGGNTGRSSAGNGPSEMLLNELPYTRLFTLLEMTVEVTDEEGDAYHLTKDFLSSLPVRDTTWVADELDRLYGTPAIEPDETDERKAELLRQKAEHDGTAVPADATAEAQAIDSFRVSRKKAL